MAILTDQVEFFGLRLGELDLVHGALFLYAAGAGLAFWIFRRQLQINPTHAAYAEPVINYQFYLLLSALALAGILAQQAFGLFNLFQDDAYALRASKGAFGFLTLSFSMLIPLATLTLVRRDFDGVSIALLLAVTLILLLTGVRFRLVILLGSAASAYLMLRGKTLRALPMLAAMVAGMFFSNLLALMRSYYFGLNTSAIGGLSSQDVFLSVGGEIGPVYVLAHVAAKPPSELIYFEPWIVGFASLVPRFLWNDKPDPDYLLLFPAGFPDPNAWDAGIAGPHQAEILLQFGWLGLPVIAFISLSVACLTIAGLLRLGREGRIAGYAIAPAFFGFYMQQRGYFAQVLNEYIAIFGPLFLVYWGQRKILITNRAYR